ncbi:RHS repeat-associated core domain-containing protein [Chryseobacterium pennae]|uniref:RHS repeat-associated core domain-containing protein n=1 Tax=Chryseobacterium pennae TaxID=2258962 RepID=UPI002938FDAD|nr:RHS repeat-associated core domain-containing protein [Chryseobacterium pennae]
MDTNNYYPFGMNHIQGSLGTSKFGSHYSYKYNGKELQETGMYDYGARFYMSDIGRWGVVDPLAEISRRFSPYNYGLNNPIMFIDPDGRKALVNDYQAMQAEYTGFIESQGNGVMGQMLGGGGRLTTSYYPGNLGSGGSGAFGGLTANTPSSVNNLMSYFNSNGSTSNSIDYLFNNYKSGYITWWTGGAEGNANTSQEMVAHMLNLNKSGIPEIREPSFYIPSQNGFFDWGNLGNAATAGAISYYALEKSIYSKQHWVDAKGIIKSTKILEKGANGKFVRGVQGLRNGYAAAGKATSVYSVAGKVVGVVGMGATVYQYFDGQITGTEATVDLVMGGIGFTPWGAPVSLIYFGGKFLYEYSTGDTLFDKPIKK